MSALSGLLAGWAIAMLEVAAKHLRVSVGSVAVNQSAAAVPLVLVPLALFWGWTWASERWSGRARLRLVLYTLGLYLAITLVGPLDVLVFAPAIEVSALLAATVEVITTTLLFVVPATIAAVFYWAFRSERIPMNRLTLAFGYLVGPSLALLTPLVAVGTVAGTATGHAWRSPNARTPIAALVLSYLRDPGAALGEAVRILRPGGRLVVVEAARHADRDLRKRMGQVRPGFEPEELAALLRARVSDVTVRALPPEPGAKGPGIVVATGRRAARRT